jgi:hypothetical protein
MKIVTIISNIMLMGLTFLLLLFEGISKEAAYLVFTLLLLLVIILNIVLVFRGRVSYKWLISKMKNKALEEQREVDDLSSNYPIMKIIAVTFNIALIGFACWVIISQYPQPKEYGVFVYELLIVLTLLLSLITILISRENKSEDMKRTIVFTGIGLAFLLFCFVLAMRIWIGHGIKERISIAKQQYSGIAEDALLAYLSDTTHTPRDRSDVAIWTLGQIRSRKALPILFKLYKNDPEGKTCKYHHDTVLCQYEIHKAIVSIEHKWLGAKEKNWFGSWSRFNK